MEKEDIKKSALEAKEAGRLLTPEELAWFWRVPASTVERMRREGTIKSAIPVDRGHRYPLILIQGLKPAEPQGRNTFRSSLKTGKRKERSRSNKGKERLWER